jgi:hypothetical protein
MGLFVGLGLLERGDLRFREHQAVLGAPRLQRLEALLHGLEVVALPDAAHAGLRDRETPALQRLGHPHLAPGRLLDGQRDDRLLDRGRGAVLENGLAAADLLQRQFAAFVVQLLEAVEAVPAVAHHLACGFRRLRPVIPNESGHLFQSKAARDSEGPCRVVSSSADG